MASRHAINLYLYTVHQCEQQRPLLAHGVAPSQDTLQRMSSADFVPPRYYVRDRAPPTPKVSAAKQASGAQHLV